MEAIGHRNRRVVIDDVATHAGVSRQTVSNVLNDRGRFTASTRDRVVRSVAELGYRPSHAARLLRSGRTATLAHPVVESELLARNLIAAQFLQLLVGAAGAAGYSLLATPAGPPDTVEQFVAEGRVDGVVLSDVTAGDARVGRLIAAGTPFAAFGRTGPGDPQCWVDVDNTGSVRCATDHVVALGHRRVGFLGYAGSSSGLWDDDRERGFREGLASAGLVPVGVERVEHAGAPAAADRLLSGPDRATAVVCGSDLLAATVYTVASAHGLRVGGDVGVTGFDGGAGITNLSPSLTTLRMPLAAIVRELVERVLREMDGPDAGPGLLLAAPLVVGESTVPLRLSCRAG